MNEELKKKVQDLIIVNRDKAIKESHAAMALILPQLADIVPQELRYRGIFRFEMKWKKLKEGGFHAYLSFEGNEYHDPLIQGVLELDEECLHFLNSPIPIPQREFYIFWRECSRILEEFGFRKETEDELESSYVITLSDFNLAY